ncbi:MAG: nucleotide exchange factor GrpE [Steroidobacter sp.]
MSTPDENVQSEIAGEAEAVSVPSEIDELKAALVVAQTKANEARDQALRAMAELDNVRKRAVRDVENAHKYAVEKFAGDLVAVKDSLEMSLAAQNSSLEDLRAGSDATLKLLNKAFERAAVVEVQAEGLPFNPEFHEAMAMVPVNDQPPNTVINVVQKGYVLNGRLVRPARVVVSKAPE